MMAPLEWTSALLVADRDKNKAPWARMMRNRTVSHIFETSDELAVLLAGVFAAARGGKHVLVAGQGTAASMKAALPAVIALTGSDGIHFSMHAVNFDRARSVDLVNGGAPLSPTVPLCDTHGTVVASGAELLLAAGALDAAKAAHGASGFNVLVMAALDRDGSRLGSVAMIESKKSMPLLISALGARAQLTGTDAVVLRTLLNDIPITLGILIAGVSAGGDKKSLERLECLTAFDAPRMGGRDRQRLFREHASKSGRGARLLVEGRLLSSSSDAAVGSAISERLSTRANHYCHGLHGGCPPAIISSLLIIGRVRSRELRTRNRSTRMTQAAGQIVVQIVQALSWVMHQQRIWRHTQTPRLVQQSCRCC